jgi:hypothetical protein
MKTKSVNVRLPVPLLAEIEAESRARGMTKSEVVRERLQSVPVKATDDPLASIRDLIGSVDDLPADLSSRVDHYLRLTGYGRSRRR